MRDFKQAARVLGRLEERIMERLWSSSPLTVREVCAALKGGPALAYTTVMTTMDRLYKKGLLRRRKESNAYVYEVAMSREDYQRQVLQAAVGDLLDESADAALAAFVDTVAEVDEANLTRLEQLIAAHRGKQR